MRILPRRKAFREQVLLDADESFRLLRFSGTRFFYGWHSHAEIELTLIVKGKGIRYVGDSIEPFQEGDLVLLGTETAHTWQSKVEDGPVQAVVIQFLPDFWGPVFSRLPEIKRMSRLFEDARRGLFVAPGPTCQQVSSLMLQMSQTPLGSPNRMIQLLQCLSLLAMSSEPKPLALSALEPLHDRRAEGLLRRVLDRIHDDRDEDKTQARMARLTGMTPQAFSRFFKRRLGKNYVRYVNDWRISRACRLLAETDQSITDIAFGVGYNNLSNFNRRFHELKGLNPRGYRRQFSSNPVVTE